MLPARERLRSERDFRQVYRAGRFWTHPLLALHVLPRPEGRRGGVTVGKKVGGAVVRNRVRRRLREALRHRIPLWKSGFDVVIAARPAAAEASFAELCAALDELARRAQLLPGPGEAPGTPYRLPASSGREPRERRGTRPAAAERRRAAAGGEE